jgi:hypothetical protein
MIFTLKNLRIGKKQLQQQQQVDHPNKWGTQENPIRHEFYKSLHNLRTVILRRSSLNSWNVDRNSLFKTYKVLFHEHDYGY